MNKSILENNTYVCCKTRNESSRVVNYLLFCGINNPHSLEGLDSNSYYGLDRIGEINQRVTTIGSTVNVISFEQFESLLNGPSIKIIDDYQIF